MSADSTGLREILVLISDNPDAGVQEAEDKLLALLDTDGERVGVEFRKLVEAINGGRWCSVGGINTHREVWFNREWVERLNALYTHPPDTQRTEATEPKFARCEQCIRVLGYCAEHGCQDMEIVGGPFSTAAECIAALRSDDEPKAEGVEEWDVTVDHHSDDDYEVCICPKKGGGLYPKDEAEEIAKRVRTALQAQTTEPEAVEALLLKIQWAGGGCPDCGVLYRKRVHKEDCTLFAILTALQEQPKNGCCFACAEAVTERKVYACETCQKRLGFSFTREKE